MSDLLPVYRRPNLAPLEKRTYTLKKKAAGPINENYDPNNERYVMLRGVDETGMPQWVKHQLLPELKHVVAKKKRPERCTFGLPRSAGRSRSKAAHGSSSNLISLGHSNSHNGGPGSESPTQMKYYSATPEPTVAALPGDISSSGQTQKPVGPGAG